MVPLMMESANVDHCGQLSIFRSYHQLQLSELSTLLQPQQRFVTHHHRQELLRVQWLAQLLSRIVAPTLGYLELASESIVHDRKFGYHSVAWKDQKLAAVVSRKPSTSVFNGLVRMWSPAATLHHI